MTSPPAPAERWPLTDISLYFYILFLTASNLYYIGMGWLSHAKIISMFYNPECMAVDPGKVLSTALTRKLAYHREF